MSHSPDPEFLQAPRSDRWWAILCLGFLAVVSIWAGVVCVRLLKVPPPPAAAVDHGPLPEAVRAKALAILSVRLKDAKLEERWESGARDFHVMGTPRPELAKDFSAPFRKDVAEQLMPLLRPYGELISFEIYNFDFAPARLRALPTKAS
ncbi:MAG TPA: hypothetical protein VFM16_03865 [Holophagaceae bacterium]|nr:hypothetical protein [Holophagaceae bacterium]